MITAEPDFSKLPDEEPPDPNQRGVHLFYLLLAILAIILIFGVGNNQQ